MFKDVNRNNKRETAKCRRCLRLKVNKIQCTQFGDTIWFQMKTMFFIGTFRNEEEDSQLYIGYNSDSYEKNDHNGANNSLMYILSNVM